MGSQISCKFSAYEAEIFLQNCSRLVKPHRPVCFFFCLAFLKLFYQILGILEPGSALGRQILAEISAPPHLLVLAHTIVGGRQFVPALKASFSFFFSFLVEQAPSAASKIFKDPRTPNTAPPTFPKCYSQSAVLPGVCCNWHILISALIA